MSDPAGRGRASLTGRLLVTYVVIFVTVLAVFGVVVTRTTSDVLESQIIRDLADEARVIDAALEPGDDQTAQAMADAGDFRLTIVEPDGTVVFDSEFDASSMENHGTRPEVIAAETDGVGYGTDRRQSATLGDDRLYVAVNGTDATRVVRISVTAQQLGQDLAAVRSSVLRVGALVGFFGLVLAWIGARRLARPVVELTAIAEGVAAGETDPQTRRSSVVEVDRLGVSLSQMATELGRRVEESESERRLLDLVLSALPQGVMLVSAEDHILYANETARELLGPFGERISTVAPRAFHRCVHAAREGQEERTIEFERGSPRRILELTATMLEGHARILVVIEDVTQAKRIEEIRRDFVADASHELKTPVAGILSSSEALEMALGRDPDRARSFVARIQASAQQLARIVEDLLDLSRVESSERPVERFRLDDVVKEQVDALRFRASASGVEMTCDLAPVEVIGSDSDVALAVRNLLDNALQYTDAGGSVRVSVAATDGSAEVSVSDTGVGIPTRSLERVFERFYRVDEARGRATGGTGLGLAIVRHVAEIHGGSVIVTSQLGVGSTFTIRLPAAPDLAGTGNEPSVSGR
jgi:two-component system phosphate regulon sensor histidine kinase PhoR